jgi:ABC-type transporter Mla MlaB component
LTASASFSPLERLCGQLNRSPGNTIVVDLSHVERMDCSGVGELVRLHACAEAAGGGTRLVNVGRLHYELLGLLRLIEPLNVCSTWSAALRGCDSAMPEIGFAWLLPGAPVSDGPPRIRRG